MLKVYKYSIPVAEYFTLDLPEDSKILTIQSQHGEPQIWVLVNINNPLKEYKFCLVGTGHPIQEEMENLIYIGTFQLLDGGFIGHLFEVKE